MRLDPCFDLVFDLLCLAATRYVFPENTFAAVADVAHKLPYAKLSQKHAAAAEYFENHRASIVFVQEARGLDEHPAIAETYLPPYTGKDPFTGVLLRRGTFDQIENISDAVREDLEAKVWEVDAPEQKAWMTTTSRVAAVVCTADGVRICAASLHCSMLSWLEVQASNDNLHKF